MNITEYSFIVQIQLFVNCIVALLLSFPYVKAKMQKYDGHRKSKLFLLWGCLFVGFNIVALYSLKFIFYLNENFIKRIYSNKNTPYFLIAFLLILIVFVLLKDSIFPNEDNDQSEVGKNLHVESEIFDGKFYKYLILFFISVSIIFVLPYLFTSRSWLVAFCRDTGTLGDTIGGIMGPFVAIAAAALTFIAFWVQYKANLAQNAQYNKQANDIAIERFENRFFKFIDYHRENVAQLKFRDSKTKASKYWEGSQVFTIIHYQVRDLLQEYISEQKKSNANYLDKLENKKNAINFIYQCVFYGAGTDGIKILKSIFPENIDYLDNSHFAKDKAAYSPELSISEDKSDKFNRFYSGYVRGLGHYFRNVYQAIRYVEDQPESILSPKKKYEYIAHFRAQMSVYEQVVFFYNSLSDLGESWEWREFSKNTPNSVILKKKSFVKLLITKYDLIRNTLFNDVNGEIIEGISIKNFYPLLNLEHEQECSVHGKLLYADNNEITNNEICRFCFNEKYIEYENIDLHEKVVEYFTRDQLLSDMADKNEFKCDEVSCKTKEIITELKQQYGI